MTESLVNRVQRDWKANPVPPALSTPRQPYRVPEEIQVSLESRGHPDQTDQEDIQEIPGLQETAVFR